MMLIKNFYFDTIQTIFPGEIAGLFENVVIKFGRIKLYELKMIHAHGSILITHGHKHACLPKK
jgi:hypothetical protein